MPAVALAVVGSTESAVPALFLPCNVAPVLKPLPRNVNVVDGETVTLEEPLTVNPVNVGSCSTTTCLVELTVTPAALVAVIV